MDNTELPVLLTVILITEVFVKLCTETDIVDDQNVLEKLLPGGWATHPCSDRSVVLVRR